jgi:tetratricopeptide (TPR) repeat protein
MAWEGSGWVNIYRGRHDAAIADLARALRLNPVSPKTVQIKTASGLAHFFAGRDAEAHALAKEAMNEVPGFAPAVRLLAMSASFLGRDDEAKEAMDTLRRADQLPKIAASALPFLLRRKEDLEKYFESLRRIGVSVP